MLLKMILSIIIPQYREDDKVVRRLLSTIDYQLNIPWDETEVIIVNDHSNTILSDEMLNSFDNIKPKYIKLEKNLGPGLARQAGLDAAQGEYVTFCDADDMYQNFGTLSVYLEEIRTKHPDIIQTKWIEESEQKIVNEQKEEKKVRCYITHDFEATWMHGKCFRKQFLTDNNLRFSDKLLYHEDSYFLSNAFEITDKISRVNCATYVWTFDEGSITRRNNAAYSYESIPEFIRAIRYSLDWLKDKTPQKIPSKVAQLTLYIFYMLQTNQAWSTEVIKPIEDEMAKTVMKYEMEFNSLDKGVFSSLDLQEHQKVAGRPFIMTETFAQWINRVLGVRRSLPEYQEYLQIQEVPNNIIHENIQEEKPSVTEHVDAMSSEQSE